MSFQPCTIETPNRWVIRREFVVQDFHYCLAVYSQQEQKEKVFLSIYEENGIGTGADLSILNHYFTEMRKDHQLFEIHDSQGALPRRLTKDKELKRFQYFGYMVYLAWKWHNMVPPRFHVFIVLFACCRGLYNYIEKIIHTLKYNELYNLLEQAGLRFPPTVDKWFAPPDKDNQLTIEAQCFRETYSLDHIMDSELEQTGICQNYQWFSEQSIKHILFGFRALSFRYICYGGMLQKDDPLALPVNIFNDILSTSYNARIPPSFQNIVFEIVLRKVDSILLTIQIANFRPSNTAPTPIHTASTASTASTPIRSRPTRTTTRTSPYNLRSRNRTGTPTTQNINTSSIETIGREILKEVDKKMLVYRLLHLTAAKLQNEDQNFTSRFLNFVTSVNFIQDPIVLEFCAEKKLPQSRTCMNLLILWDGYKSEEEMKEDLMKAIEMSGDLLLNQ